MKDINGKKIEIGDTVKTVQPSGGILSPAPPTTGIVAKPPLEFTKDGLYLDTLFIKYNKIYKGVEITQYIDLSGKINEILIKNK